MWTPPPDHPARPRTYVKVIVLAAVSFMFIGVVGLSYAWYRHEHEDDRVQRAADRLSTPAGWKYLGHTTESGSPFLCIVSCFHPQVTKVYRTDVEPLQACAVLEAWLAREVATPVRQTWASGCGWRAPLHDVGGRADVGAFAETGRGT
jgi:hypothetical protein